MKPATPLLFACIALLSCNGPGDDSATVDDTSTGDDTGPPDRPEWHVETVMAHDGGLQLDLLVTDAGPVMAYYGNQPWQDGTCTEIVFSPPPRMRYDLYFLDKRSGTWTESTVDQPMMAFEPYGVSIALDPTGSEVLAYTGGVPEFDYCGANDATLARPDGSGGWAFETAMMNSGESNTGMPASDAGFVVGLWPSLAFGPTGEPAVLHRDAHFGYLQSDDLRRADAEFSNKAGGGWGHVSPDPGEGAGDWAQLLFDSTDRAVGAYAINLDATDGTRRGVWASREDGAGGWERVWIHSGTLENRLSMREAPDGSLAIAVYSVDDKAIVLRRLSNLDEFADESAWTRELVGKAQYDTGHYASVDFTSDGRAAIAYRRCKRIANTTGGCDTNEEAIMFAIEDGSGGWDYEEVRHAEQGSCGEYTKLDIHDDTAYIGFRCTVEEDGDFAFRPMLAWRDL